jgi:hypothetical protein
MATEIDILQLPTAEVIQAAQDAAGTSRDQAIAARDAAIAARNAAQAVPTTTDGLVTAIAEDETSDFAALLKGQIVAETAPLLTPKLDKSEAATSYSPILVPSYAGVRTKTWDQARAVYNAESPDLRKFQAKFASVQRSGLGLRIATPGDSKSFGSGLGSGIHTFNDSYPAQLADLLGGVPGLIAANLSDYQWSANTGFTAAAANRNDLTTGASGGTVTLWPLRATTSMRFHGYIPSGGTVSITVDGGAAQTWTVPGGSPWKSFDITGLANTRHVFVISTTFASFALKGASYIHAGTPIIVDNHGRQGATASNWLPSAWLTLWEGVASGNIAPAPDLILLGLGTNLDTTANLQAVAANAKALAPTILLAPGGLPSGSTYDPRRAQVYDVADALDLPVIDLTQVIGDFTKANVSALMNADTVHESGKGYALEARAIARVIRAA